MSSFVRYVRCRYPGCPSFVDKKGASGMCRHHMHQGGLCGCMRCRRLAGAAAAAPGAAPAKPQRPDRITVQVATHVTTSSADNKVGVSLPRAPWERVAHV